MLTPLNLFPIKSLPKDTLLNFEYIIHFVSTFILAIFFFNIKTKLSNLNKILILIIFIFFKEFLQELTGTRGFQIKDILVDIVSILISKKISKMEIIITSLKIKY
jgi:VanZ family protein